MDTQEMNPMTQKQINSQKHYQENKEKYKARAKAWKASNPEKVSAGLKSYRERNKELLATKSREYYQSHTEQHKLWNLNWMRESRKDPIFRLAKNMRHRLYKALKGETKGISAVKDLGCSIGQLKLYIENQFEPGMSWDNYGEWHLDHVVPISHFDLSEKSQLLEAFNWLNYQPLWARDNLKKGNKKMKTNENLNVGGV
jgi:hypothetical protein